MGFLAPNFLFALTLASVPIIIHLLNRRRFMTVDWAPMRYLKLTIKSNRRRMRIEQLILLAVRTAMVALLVLALARPVLSQTGLGSWLGGRGRVSRVIVIDDSLSMGYQLDGRGAFEAAKEVAAGLAENVGAQDSLTVLVTSSPNAPLVRELHVEDANRLQGLIRGLPLSDTANHWSATFATITDHLSAATFPTREVTIVTDMRRSGWGDDVAEVIREWSAQSASLRIIDVGTRETGNVSIAAFEREDVVALPGATVNLRALVRNDEPAAVTGAQAVLLVGDESRPVILPELPAGQVAEIPLSLALQRPGPHALHLSLPSDRFPQDNARWLNITVQPSLSTVLIDGDPSSRPFESETDFIALAFSVGSEPWKIRRLIDSEWNASAPLAADLMVVANVASLTPAQIEQLERLVRDGMGLIIFAGDHLDADHYNEHLYRNGGGLLPAAIDGIIDEPVTGVVIEGVSNSPIEPLKKLTPAALTRIQARRYLAVKPPAAADEAARVLARWNDSDARPAIVEKRFGRGRVLLFTTTADRAWSDWPIDPTYVLAARSAALAIARSDAQDNVTAGQPIQYMLPPGERALEPTITIPGSDVPETVELTQSDDGRTILRFTRTAHAGVYQIRWKDPAGGERQHQLCVSFDKRESDLTPIDTEQLSTLLANVDHTIVHYRGDPALLAGRGHEIWKTVATIVLTLAAIECLLAVWVGRER